RQAVPRVVVDTHDALEVRALARSINWPIGVEVSGDWWRGQSCRQAEGPRSHSPVPAAQCQTRVAASFGNDEGWPAQVVRRWPGPEIALQGPVWLGHPRQVDIGRARSHQSNG